ncbi:protein FAM124B [Rhinatrema bivittatum]|uniref:protein FAM124B n=1 Tax=Rhinatrema bivittatum TaxID=194408 RepID=UPI001128B7AB|nr:protein FAM124B [Rhinatrema bivittatum]XP_029472851.1 protein FAM124B [Rhinatrema bivittatum]
MSSVSSDFPLDERQESLNMTVHLLASSGDSLLLQQTVNHLLHWICPGIQLFLVSEQAPTFKYYERHHKKRSGFPGISVLLFLHEDLGEERIVQVHNFFQHPPWQYHHTEKANGRLCPFMLANQDFYSLDTHMPVWGVRQVHYGMEILRVTLYCNFDNYEDAVRLYEMILQREATTQKSNFCFFVLHSTNSVSVQLSLKQLPPGVPVELKESSVLQFKVQEIGRLVPLLPNQCIPISRTRWQTQDYDGNKILLQVQGSSSNRHGLLSPQQENAGEEKDLHNLTHPSRETFPNRRATGENTEELLPVTADQKNRYSRSEKHGDNFGETSEQSESLASGSSCSTPRSGSCCSSQGGSSAVTSELDVSFKSSRTSQEPSYQTREAETNVDTGFTVVNSSCSLSCLSRFSRDLQSSLLSHPSQQTYLSTASGTRTNLPSAERAHHSLLAVKRNKGPVKADSKLDLYLMGISQTHLGNGKAEEEEFYI